MKLIKIGWHTFSLHSSQLDMVMLLQELEAYLQVLQLFSSHHGCWAVLGECLRSSYRCREGGGAQYECVGGADWVSPNVWVSLSRVIPSLISDPRSVTTSA